MAVKAIPEGYHTATPYLIIDGASDALAFYARAFGAKELFRMPGPDGRVGHAEIQIGTSRLMLADENPTMGAKGPKAYGGSPITLMLYVEDVDSFVQGAVDAGAKIERPIADQFYGDRSGGIVDPFGHHWYIATHKEDVPPEEMDRRLKAMMAPAQ